MNREAAVLAMGSACVHASMLLILSWIPSLAYLGGAAWATAPVAGLAHRLTLTAIVVYALAVGARVRRSGDRSILEAWAWRCLLPLAGYALFTHLAVRATAHVSRAAILCYMAASVPLALYGFALKRESLSPSSAKSS